VGEKASLDGPLAKVNRARFHLRTLNREIGAFKRSKSAEFLREEDLDAGEVVLRLKVLREPKNPEWGLLAGDLVHNLRSALDHLVCQLVLLHGGKPSRENQFPIVRVKNDYWLPQGHRTESVRDRLLAGIPDDERAPIDGVQPYNAGDKAGITTLALLSQLSNADKHRVIHAAFVMAQKPTDDSFSVTTPDASGAVAEITVNYGFLEDGADVLRVKADPPGTTVNVDAKLAAQIGFGEVGLPSAGFSTISKWVENYVRSFKPVFEGKPHPGVVAPG
jgi:hypothetical protein